MCTSEGNALSVSKVNDVLGTGMTWLEHQVGCRLCKRTDSIIKNETQNVGEVVKLMPCRVTMTGWNMIVLFTQQFDSCILLQVTKCWKRRKYGDGAER